jgi:hypothetical protein
MVADSPRSPRRALRPPRSANARPGTFGGGAGSHRSSAAHSASAAAAAAAAAATAIHTARPPILLELSSAYVRAGFVGQLSSPQITLCPPNSGDQPHPQAPASEWYRYYSPILQDATSYVLESSAAISGAASSSSSSTADHGRRVLVIHHGMPQMGKNQRQALQRLLLKEYNVPAVSFQPAMKVAFFAAGSAGAAQLTHGMVAYVHDGEAHCVAVAHSQSLDYTYQATGRCPTPNEAGGPATLQEFWDTCWKGHLLNAESPHSMVMCILRCLEACSRDDRRRVVSHLVFCGEWFVSDPAKVQKYVAQQVRKALTPAESSASQSSRVPPPADDADATKGEEEEEEEGPPQLYQLSYTHRAVSKAMRTQFLADSVGLVRAPNNVPCEVLPWVGANIWAKHWHSTHPDSPAFQWETL